MTSKENAAGVVATPATASAEKEASFFLTARRFLKAAIVVATLHGCLPYAVAEWLIQHGGLRHV